MARKKLGYLRPYKSYIFRGRDPILNKVNAAINDSGLTKQEIHKRSGVSASTLYNWRPQGKTRRPQFCTVEATLRPCGKTLVVADIH